MKSNVSNTKKNIVKPTRPTIISRPYPKHQPMNHISEVMLIRWSANIFTIIERGINYLITHSPKYCIKIMERIYFILNLMYEYNHRIIYAEKACPNWRYWISEWIGCTTTQLNASPPSAAYMRQWIGSALVQIMACRLFGAKPLSKPMLHCCQLGRYELISVTISHSARKITIAHGM